MEYAMDRHPLMGGDAGGVPLPKAENMSDGGMQIQGAMCLMAVYKNGDAGDGDVCQQQCDAHEAPHGQAQQSFKHMNDILYGNCKHSTRVTVRWDPRCLGGEQTRDQAVM